MNEIWGLLLALGAALAWGSYIVPFKKSKSQDFYHFQALMGVGILASGFVISLLFGYSLKLNIYGVISGILWAAANVILLVAVLNLALSRAAPIVASLIILSSFLWGLLVFEELPDGVMLGSFGIGLIILGVILVSSTSAGSSQNKKRGLLAAILSGLIFGSQLTPLKYGQVATKDFFFSVCFGIFFTALLIAVIQKVKFKKKIWVGMISGAIWNIGNLLSLLSISLIGLSKGLPISQSASLVAVLWGIFYFKEITRLRQKIQVLLGAIILLVGIFILGSA